MISGEVLVVTSTGSGHLFPCIELCKRISSRNYKTTLVLPSNLSSSVPSSFFHDPLLGTAEISPFSGGPPMPGSNVPPQQLCLDLESYLSRRASGADSPPSVCAVIDFQMGWTKHVFWKFNIPVISFFTFGACAAAMEWGAWKSDAGNMNPGEVLQIPGLPEEMHVAYSDLKRPSGGNRPSHVRPPGGGGGPPRPGDQPPWVPLIEGSVALMFNTCDDLERPFIEYMANQMGMPVWGVGPLLPDQYWQSSDSLILDREIRESKRRSNCTEDEVIQWLNSKPRGSVLYVSFGSETGPTMEEYPHLADALQESTYPFIWVIQPGSGIPKHPGSKPPALDGSGSEEGYDPQGLDGKVGDRGLIIRGWAPQLLILSHPSTGGFLSHCGWNSTAEAIGRGVPFLAWPIRGDQIYNAKLVVNHLKVGYMALAGGSSETVEKVEIVEGIEKLMGDEDVRRRAALLCDKFKSGFPASSEAALDAFGAFITQNQIDVK